MSAIAVSTIRRGLLAAVAAAAVAAPARGQDHLILSEVCVTPGAAEFVEIYNPTNSTIDLSNYYLADNILYARTSTFFGTPAGGDFVVRFPAGATINPGSRKVMAFDNAGFLATYGINADFEMLPDDFGNTVPAMLAAWVGSVSGSRALTDAGEALYLYYWDQQSDLVKDVDIIRHGIPSAGDNLGSKTGLAFDGPDEDTVATPYLHESITMGTMTLTATAGLSYKRRYSEGLNEQACGGNGITGHQELTENIAINWDGNTGPLTAPNPGTGVVLTAPPGQCYADTNNDLQVNVTDLLAIIGTWGACVDCPANDCVTDIAPSTCNDCQVNVTDLLAVIGSWGACP